MCFVYVWHFQEGDCHGYEKLLPSRTELGLVLCGKQNNSVHDFHDLCTTWQRYLCEEGVCGSVPVRGSEAHGDPVLPFGRGESVRVGDQHPTDQGSLADWEGLWIPSLTLPLF